GRTEEHVERQRELAGAGQDALLRLGGLDEPARARLLEDERIVLVRLPALLVVGEGAPLDAAGDPELRGDARREPPDEDLGGGDLQREPEVGRREGEAAPRALLLEDAQRRHEAAEAVAEQERRRAARAIGDQARQLR